MKRSWLDVDNSRSGRKDRYCLDGFPRVVLGSSPHATLPLVSHSPEGWYSPLHAALTRLDGRWQLADLGSTKGVFMNKAQMKSARWLDSGDVFYVVPTERLTFTEEPIDPRVLAHVLRLALSPDAEADWLVFSDALQELGDDTGKKMLSARDDVVPPLGFLYRMRTDGTVRFSCRYGFIHTLTLRNVGLAQELRTQVIDAVLAQPAVCLLRELELDMTSFDEVPLDVLAAAVVRAAPPSLRVVRLLGMIGSPPKRLFPPSIHVEWAPI